MASSSDHLLGLSALVRKGTWEEALEYDKYVIGIFKEQEEELVGHIPIKFCQLIHHFLNQLNENLVEAAVSRKIMREIGLVSSQIYDVHKNSKNSKYSSFWTEKQKRKIHSS